MKTNKTLLIIEDEKALNETILQRALLELSVNKNTNSMNEELLEIKTQYEPAIDKANAKIKEYDSAIKTFCKKNKRLFKESKTLKLTYGSIQQRTGQPTLKLIKGHTWESVTNKLFELFSNKYVSVKKTLNKPSVVRAFNDNEIKTEALVIAGAEIKQGENFNITINWDEIKTPDTEK